MPFALELPVEPEVPCPYLPDQLARYRALAMDAMPPAAYQRFMDAGFRRSGHVVYQPACRSCRACLPLRVPVADFIPRDSQRRVWRRNRDLQVAVGRPHATDEKLALYNRYNTEWHGGEELTLAAFAETFYASCVETLEFTYRTSDGTLIAAGLCDLTPQALSSVYFYFHPALAARGLGTYGALCEIDFARGHGLPFYYLGFWIERCPSMVYKANYRPHELLGLDGQWKPAASSAAGSLLPTDPASPQSNATANDPRT